MTNICLTLIHPLILAKIKPYQNLSLIFSSVLLLLCFTLSPINNKILSNIIGHLLALSIVLIILFIILSLPFLIFKRLEIATIKNGIMFTNIDHKPAEFSTQNLRFLLNINRKSSADKEPLTLEMIKNLSTWGNYIVIRSESTQKDIYMQFIPDEDLLKVLPQLKIETYNGILMNDTIHLTKQFISMLWSTSGSVK